MCQKQPQAPPAPDYTGAAKEQGVANLEAARTSAHLSNPNIYSPYGNQTVTYNGDDPTVTQTLTPEAQAALSSQQRVQGALGGLAEQGIGQAQTILGTPFKYNGPDIQTNLDMSGVAKMPVNAGTTAQAAILSRLQPQIQQNADANRQRLANQGLVAGGEAYNNEMRNQYQGENDLYTQAALQGLNLDMSANQQGYNQALGSAEFGNQAAGQSLQQQLGLYNQPLNQITALMSGSQIQNPQFQSYTGSNVQPTPIANATNLQGQYAQNLYGQQMASYNANQGGIMDLLGSAATAGGMWAASDVRLKSNIVRVGTHPLGIGIYDYDIFGERTRGVMAHEVETVMPDAVVTMSNGFKAVNYGALNV